MCHKWRSLQQLQDLAIGGTFGRKAGILALKVKELRSELEARGVVINKKMLRDDLQASLDQILRGVMRVPALLPTQQLSSLNLDKYEVMASEPLHDIKGHVINLITELPSILPPGDTATKCIHLIDSCLAKEKKSGADLRRAVIQIYLLLKDLNCSSKILLLLQTIIKIGEITYSLDDSTWSCAGKISKSRMFGHYLHAITAHIPTQLVYGPSTRKIKSDSSDKLGELQRHATNHHPDNAIPQIMLRLQKTGTAYDLDICAEGRLPGVPGTASTSCH